MGDFRKLRVWRNAHALMLNVHTVATEMRAAQFLSLRSQVVRAAMSIPANIVEGRAHTSEREFARFLGYSIASTRELEYHLLAAHDIDAIDTATYAGLLEDLTIVRRMRHGLTATLEGHTRKTDGSVTSQ